MTPVFKNHNTSLGNHTGTTCGRFGEVGMVPESTRCWFRELVSTGARKFFRVMAKSLKPSTVLDFFPEYSNGIVSDHHAAEILVLKEKVQAHER